MADLLGGGTTPKVGQESCQGMDVETGQNYGE